MGSFFIRKEAPVTVRRDGSRVLLIQNGATLLDMPWQGALDLANALKIQGRRAEQNSKIAQVISDQALLIRKGVPIALSPFSDVIKEAGNEAAHDRTLRRACPGGIAPMSKVGFPALRDLAKRPPTHVISPGGIPTEEKIGRIGGK
jgi:hypothetical protein